MSSLVFKKVNRFTLLSPLVCGCMFSYGHNWGGRETGLAERSSGGTVFNFDISCFVPDAHFVMPQKMKENRIFFFFFSSLKHA